jgi:hypothetical protein
MKKSSPLIILLTGIFLLCIIFIYKTYPNNISQEKSINQFSDPFNKSDQIHWSHIPITYSLENQKDCGSQEIQRIKRAFEVIKNETDGKVSFIETNTLGDIQITCHKASVEYDWSKNSEGYRALAESTYYLEEDTYPKVISYGTIDFYDTLENRVSSNCKTYPDTEIHEILHLFGFDHVNEKYNIMNPVQIYCPSSINKDIINRLDEIYNN